MRQFFIFILLMGRFVSAQSFAPIPGEVGSTAIHKDSSIIASWATGVTVQRGPLDIAQPGNGNASFGTDSDAIGQANGNVVSFGDGGSAVVTFAASIMDGPGFDFAIFENGFTDNYIELAFVEVSSDGINFFRFPAVSEWPTIIQLSNFDYSDCRYFDNLAGKYRANYGTPFDLEELSGEVGLDINAITHVKLIDVVGFVDPTYGTQDSQGNYINDPYPTAFPSGGFDLDAVAVIHEGTQTVQENSVSKISIYPNPSSGLFNIKGEGRGSYSITSSTGQLIFNSEFSNDFNVDLSNFPKGIYILHVNNGSGIYIERLNKI
ncbi:MAG: T9SS type A sorting domain-containing protein [Crocinitomicaceae bacterium]|nr:T9SS type A sorting domain-containing protein [Crocinitomicaceae bacterium]